MWRKNKQEVFFIKPDLCNLSYCSTNPGVKFSSIIFSLNTWTHHISIWWNNLSNVCICQQHHHVVATETAENSFQTGCSFSYSLWWSNGSVEQRWMMVPGGRSRPTVDAAARSAPAGPTGPRPWCSRTQTPAARSDEPGLRSSHQTCSPGPAVGSRAIIKRS